MTGDPHAGQKGRTIGNYPACVVNATDPSHVPNALSFAKEHNVRLSIKNTGHGCKTNASVHGSPKIAATLGAGVQDEEMYAALAKHNAISVGGTSPVRPGRNRRTDGILLLTSHRLLASSDGLLAAGMAWRPDSTVWVRTTL